MAAFEISFEWWVDSAGYEHIPPKRRSDQSGTLGSIRGKGGPARTIRPLEFHPTLFKQFGDLSRGVDWTYGTDSGDQEAIGRALAFVSSFGFPRGRQTPTDPDPIDEEQVWDIFLMSADLADRIAAWRAAPADLIGIERPTWSADHREGEAWISNLSAVLRPAPPDGHLALHIVPDTLYDAMMLQFARMVAGGGDLAACAWCGEAFERGAAGRRVDAKFCSDKCRVRYHNNRKLKGAKS